MTEWTTLINQGIREACKAHINQTIADMAKYAEWRRKYLGLRKDQTPMAKKKEPEKDHRRAFCVILRRRDDDGKQKNAAVMVHANHCTVCARGSLVFYDGSNNYGCYTNLVAAFQPGSWLSVCRHEVPHNADVQAQATGDRSGAVPDANTSGNPEQSPEGRSR